MLVTYDARYIRLKKYHNVESSAILTWSVSIWLFCVFKDQAQAEKSALWWNNRVSCDRPAKTHQEKRFLNGHERSKNVRRTLYSIKRVLFWI